MPAEQDAHRFNKGHPEKKHKGCLAPQQELLLQPPLVMDESCGTCVCGCGFVASKNTARHAHAVLTHIDVSRTFLFLFTNRNVFFLSFFSLSFNHF